MELTPRVIRGDAKALPLDDGSVHCVVTSPPYWGLRAYGGDPGMIGLEPTLDDHLDNLVQVFREVRRVLRDDGTLWLNYGDAYASGASIKAGRKQDAEVKEGARCDDFRDARYLGQGGTVGFAGMKPKDLMLLPARAAMALQSDGWWLRSEIVWSKPNPMPESVTDRPTSAHEKVFLLSKRSRYFYDADAVRVDRSEESIARDKRASYTPAHVPPGSPNHSGCAGGRGRGEYEGASGANLRNVWSIPTQGYSGAHFATFPLALAKRCILAGTSEKGVCADCGAPWVREVEKTLVLDRDDRPYLPTRENPDANDQGASRQSKHIGGGAKLDVTTTGWHPSCACDSRPAPATVFDPFGGSGTVGIAAEQLGRKSILNEINADYCTMAQDRINNTQPMMAYA